MILLAITTLLAFYVAWNLGANDVANSMGTSVGSGAISLRRALVIAAILEFSGAVLFGQQVSTTLAKGIVDPSQFVGHADSLVLGMLTALVVCGLWLQLATALGLPVASSHAIVGAIAGVGWVASSGTAVDWSLLGQIALAWVFTPVLSGGLAALFYSLLCRWILEQPNPLAQLREWIPWLSTAVVGTVGAIVLPSLLQAETVAQWWPMPTPIYTVWVLLAMAAIALLTLTSWQHLSTLIERHSTPVTASDTLFATPNGTTGLQALVENHLARFQVISASLVAFAHGSNDVGNAIAPLATIVQLQQTGAVQLESVTIPLWVLGVGAVGIVTGLATWGRKVITTVGQGIMPLQPSSGLCAELATAATILLASRLGLPVSTSHAIVGSVVGISLWRYWLSRRSPIQLINPSLVNAPAGNEPTVSHPLQLKVLQEIGLAWVATVPVVALLTAGLFDLLTNLWHVKLLLP